MIPWDRNTSFFLDFCLKSLVILKAIEEGSAKGRVG